MVLHEFPEEIVTYFLLLQSDINERAAFLDAFAAAALASPA